MGTYSWVSLCSSAACCSSTPEPYFWLSILTGTNVHILVQLCFRQYIHTGTYCPVSLWHFVPGYTLHTETYFQVSCCSSASFYTFKKTHTLRYLGASLLQAILYIPKGTYSWVSWDSSFSDYAYTQGHTLGYISASLCHTMQRHAICAYPQEPTLGYPIQLCFRLHLTHRDLFSGTLVQLFIKMYFEAIQTHRNLLSGILAQQPYFRLNNVCTTNKTLLLGIQVQLYFKL